MKHNLSFFILDSYNERYNSNSENKKIIRNLFKSLSVKCISDFHYKNNFLLFEIIIFLPVVSFMKAF